MTPEQMEEWEVEKEIADEVFLGIARTPTTHLAIKDQLIRLGFKVEDVTQDVTMYDGDVQIKFAEREQSLKFMRQIKAILKALNADRNRFWGEGQPECYINVPKEHARLIAEFLFLIRR